MNESAFPIQRHRDENGYEYDPISFGMTLRDYFAAKAPDMPAWWFESWETNERNKAKKKDTYIMRGRLEALTEWRFSFADAMLKARGKAEGMEGK